MKLRKKDIDRLIDILQQKKIELESEEDDYKFEFTGTKKRLEYGMFPDKWCIKTTPEINSVLNHFLIENHDYYKGYTVNWKVSKSGNYFHFPQYSVGAHSELEIKPDYIEITFEQFNDKYNYIPF